MKFDYWHLQKQGKQSFRILEMPSLGKRIQQAHLAITLQTLESRAKSVASKQKNKHAYRDQCCLTEVVKERPYCCHSLYSRIGNISLARSVKPPAYNQQPSLRNTNLASGVKVKQKNLKTASVYYNYGNIAKSPNFKKQRLVTEPSRGERQVKRRYRKIVFDSKGIFYAPVGQGKDSIHQDGGAIDMKKTEGKKMEEDTSKKEVQVVKEEGKSGNKSYSKQTSLDFYLSSPLRKKSCIKGECQNNKYMRISQKNQTAISAMQNIATSPSSWETKKEVFFTEDQAFLEEGEDPVREEEASDGKLILKKSMNRETLKSIKSIRKLQTIKQIDNSNWLEGERKSKIGEGGSGTVWKFKLKGQLSFIAVKKVNAPSGSSEFETMQALSGHPFMVELLDACRICTHGGSFLELSMRYYTGGDLGARIKRQGNFSFPQVKLFTYQIFRALHFMHCSNFIHRDVKSANIFTQGHNLVLGDFGSAVSISGNKPHCSYVCLRSNRAPELVVGSKFYTQKIDIWSAGCVICEMILGRPLFESQTSQELLINIIKVRGSLSMEEFNSLNKAHKIFTFDTLPKGVRQATWSQVLEEQSLCSQLGDLLDNILKIDPSSRFSALEALKHPYFDDIRKEESYEMLQRKYSLDENLFVFLPNEVSEQDRRSLVPEWVPESLQVNREQDFD